MRDKRGFGTAPVFITAITSIIGAILFLRFGYAVGTLGFLGALLIVAVGHFITIPSAMALSELSTNQKVEGGGEYFIISRSFGLNLGSVIGIALYLSQAISIAFFVITFTEAFEPLFTWINSWSVDAIGFEFPRQIISVPAIIALTSLVKKKNTFWNLKTLYFIAAIVLLSLFMFFIGDNGYSQEQGAGIFSFQKGSIHDNFFTVFAIVFPAFAGMTTGVGLAGDLKNPSKSIPIGITAAVLIGMIIYILVAYKLAISASIDDLTTDYYIMRKVSAFGFIFIPLGLAAATLFSAISILLVAPRTLRALALDNSLPIKSLNRYIVRGNGKSNELSSAKTITSIIAICIVIAGEIDSVARIITILFLITYGSICLISFLYHFGGDPSYRPVFRSKWYVSLTGFLFSLLILFKIDVTYAIISLSVMAILYLYVSNNHKERSGIQEIFKGVIFQLSRRLQIYIQKNTRRNDDEKWRPSIVCISKNSFERDKSMRLLEWISEKHGFGTYIHLIEDYFSESTNDKKNELRSKLIDRAGANSNIYIDMLISPSFTSAIAQAIQLPGVSGMPNNMILFEFDKQKADGLRQISENLPLAKAANLDIGIFATTNRKIRYKNGIHIWITNPDLADENFMILLGFVIISHPEWSNSKIRIFEVVTSENKSEKTNNLLNSINSGRLPISPAHIEFVVIDSEEDYNKKINECSNEAGLVIMDFQIGQVQLSPDLLYTGFEQMGDMLFVNASSRRSIS